MASQGDGHGALSAYQQGREIIARLLKQSPDNATLRNDLLWSMGKHRTSEVANSKVKN